MRTFIVLLLTAALLSPQQIIVTKKKAGGGGGASATDDFNRANGGLGANWTAQDGALTIASNQLTVASGFHCGFYNATSFAANHKSEYTMINSPSLGGLSVFEAHVRMSGTGGTSNHYGFTYDGSATSIYKTVSGSDTTLTCTGCGSFTYQTGDILRLTISGTSLTGEIIRGGSAVHTGTATDSSLASGSPGVCMYLGSGTAPILDNWAGADL